MRTPPPAVRIAAASVGQVAATARASTAEHVLVLLPRLDAAGVALARAELGPLADARAPARVNALAGEVGGAAERVARFLEAAPSTTGQLLVLA